MKVLVTGGAGFIGSHISDYLLEKNYQVRVLDNLSNGNLDNIKHLQNNPNFEFMWGDITDLQTCHNAVKGVDLVCHQAALGSVPRSIENPILSHKSNVDGYLNLLVAAKEAGIKRFVYASSSSVYGDSEILPKQEENIGNCLSPYAVTKRIDELYGKVFNKCYDMETIGLRYFNVFGPRQNPNGAYAAVIPKFISSLKNNKVCDINGDGNFSRDFTFVKNVVYANYLALTTNNTECFGDFFNIGAGGRITINDMYYSIAKCLSSNLKPNYLPIRKGDIPHSNADVSKAKNMLNYDVLYNFDEGIKLTIDYY